MLTFGIGATTAIFSIAPVAVIDDQSKAALTLVVGRNPADTENA
jgi:hypothetical protein